MDCRLTAALTFALALGWAAEAQVPRETTAAVARIHVQTLCTPSVEACTSYRPTVLKGSWGFEKGVLLAPDTILSLRSPSLQTVPHVWNPTPLHPLSTLWSQAKDVGTYWLFIDGFLGEQPLAINLRGIFTAYRVLWVAQDGTERVVELDRLGWDAEQPLQSASSIQSRIVPLPAMSREGRHLLVIHVANAFHAKGGMRAAPLLGSPVRLQEDQLQNSLVLAFLVGSMLIIALYHLMLFRQRKGDKASLFLALQCLTIAGFSFCRAGFLEVFLPNPNTSLLHLRTAIEYGTHVLGPSFFYFFLIHSFPDLRSRWQEKLFVVPAVLALFLLFLPLPWLSRLYVVCYITLMAIAIVAIFVRVLVGLQRHRELRYLFLGILCLALTAVHDALVGAEIIRNRSLLPYAQAAFMLLQGGVISRLFAKAYADAALHEKQAYEAQQLRMEREEALRLETQFRFESAAATAHYLNNPLNYIQVGFESLRLNVDTLRCSLFDILNASEPSDELTAITQSFTQIFGQIEDDLARGRLGIDRAAEFIREFRSLSGIDGLEWQRVPIAEVLRKALERFETLHGRGFARQLVQEPGEPDTSLYCNRYIVQSICTRIWAQLSKTAASIAISYERVPAGIILRHSWTEPIALEDSQSLVTQVRYLAQSGQLHLSVDVTPRSFHVTFLDGDAYTEPKLTTHVCG